MAAGMGTRFGKMTETMPKGFIPYKGKAMVVRSIETLISCGIERIIIGTGYQHECYDALKKQYPQIECVLSPRYAETNSMYTLWNCREAIGSDDFLLLESDLVFEPRAIRELIDCAYDSAMLITPVTKFQDQYYVEMNSKCELVACSTNEHDIHPQGELVGIHKLSNKFYKICIDDYATKVEAQPKFGYEYQLLHTSRHLMPMNVLRLEGLQWYEIDDIDDLTFAEQNVKIE